MGYINTPLHIQESSSGLHLKREINDIVAKLDNLIDLIVFTPKGSFLADPDFGFEYWNYEFANIHYQSFNSGQALISTDGFHKEITKAACQDSIRRSLASYEPLLKDIYITIELDAANEETHNADNISSRHIMKIVVEGALEHGSAITQPYKKEVVFLLEPTIKKTLYGS